jgi:hypothetical protein
MYLLWSNYNTYSTYREKNRKYTQFFGAHYPEQPDAVRIARRAKLKSKGITAEEIEYNAYRVHIERDVEPTLLSLFNIRGRFGIGQISFSDFIRTPYKDMPLVTESCVERRLGNRVFVDNGISDVFIDSELTPPEFWRDTVLYWRDYCHLNIPYHSLVENPQRWTSRIAALFLWRPQKFTDAPPKTGYAPTEKEIIAVPDEDVEYLAQFKIEEIDQRAELDSLVTLIDQYPLRNLNKISRWYRKIHRRTALESP